MSAAARPQFESASRRFKERLQSCYPELHPDHLGRAIRPVGTIHLTLGVMSLTDQNRVDEAIKFLEAINYQELYPDNLSEDKEGDRRIVYGDSENQHEVPNGTNDHYQISNMLEGEDEAKVKVNQEKSRPENSSQQFTITLSSLKSTKDARKTSVLYAEPVDASNRLLPFCERLRQKFTEAGFVLPENRPLKLHATILNTIYGTKTGQRGARRKKPSLIDATGLVREFGEFDWAKDVVLEKIAICKMGAQKIEKEDSMVDEQYEEIAVKPLSM